MMPSPTLRRFGLRMGGNKLVRRTVLLPTLVLPKAQRMACFAWIKGRHEFQKLEQADYVIVSFPHSGRTWLRAMLTRYYQAKYQLGEMRLIGLKWPHKRDPRVPKLLFTHDQHISKYTGHRDNKVDFYDKRVLLLVRDPRDVAVSAYHSIRYRPNPTRYDRRAIDPRRFDAFKAFGHIRARVVGAIDFMNAWQRESDRIGRLLSVRYEDLSVAPAIHLRRVLEFLGAEPSEAEVMDAVNFAAFDNLQKLEREGGFGDDHRIKARDPDRRETYKVRRGKVGGYRDYLSEEQVAELDALVSARLDPGFGYTTQAAAPCPESVGPE